MTERPPEAPMHRRPMDPDEPDWPPEPVEPAPAPPPAIGTLPPGAAPLRIAVPAFWTLEPKYDQAWRDLKEAQAPRLVADVTVIPDSWPSWPPRPRRRTRGGSSGGTRSRARTSTASPARCSATSAPA